MKKLWLVLLAIMMNMSVAGFAQGLESATQWQSYTDNNSQPSVQQTFDRMILAAQKSSFEKQIAQMKQTIDAQAEQIAQLQKALTQKEEDVLERLFANEETKAACKKIPQCWNWVKQLHTRNVAALITQYKALHWTEWGRYCQMVTFKYTLNDTNHKRAFTDRFLQRNSSLWVD